MYNSKVTLCSLRIAEALKIRGMRQSELCKRANVPKSSLSLYLSGAYEPKQDRVYDLAKALDVDEAWLMGYDVPMRSSERINLELFGESPDELKLTEGEKTLLEAFRKLTPKNQEIALQMILGALEAMQ